MNIQKLALAITRTLEIKYVSIENNRDRDRIIDLTKDSESEEEIEREEGNGMNRVEGRGSGDDLTESEEEIEREEGNGMNRVEGGGSGDDLTESEEEIEREEGNGMNRVEGGAREGGSPEGIEAKQLTELNNTVNKLKRKINSVMSWVKNPKKLRVQDESEREADRRVGDSPCTAPLSHSHPICVDERKREMERDEVERKEPDAREGLERDRERVSVDGRRRKYGAIVIMGMKRKETVEDVANALYNSCADARKLTQSPRINYYQNYALFQLKKTQFEITISKGAECVKTHNIFLCVQSYLSYLSHVF
jgi:hypothetical protein